MKRVIASQLTREWISGISKTNVFIEYHSHLVITNAEALTQGIKRVASTLGGPVSEIKIDARWLGSSLRAHLLNQTPFMSDSPKITNEEGQETDVDYAVFVHANGNPLPDTQFLRLVDQINRSLSATYFPGRQRDKPYLFFRHPNYLFRARSSLGESTFSLQLDISLKNCAPAGYQYGPTIFGIMASDSHLEYLDSFAPLHITEHIFFLPYNSAPDYTLLFRFLKSTRRIIQPYLFDVMLASVIVTATNTDPSTHCRKQLDQLSEDNLAQLSCNTNALTAFTKHAHRSSLLLGNMTDLSKIILTYEKNDLPPTNGRTKKELQAAIVKAFSEFESYIKDRKASPHFER
ncbi:hypothetical protein EBR96_09190, partial [bacterium]|nr:hypothetical protein [bacterium]